MHFVAQGFSLAVSRPKGLRYVTPFFDANNIMLFLIKVLSSEKKTATEGTLEDRTSTKRD